jgi:hypothetical protein
LEKDVQPFAATTVYNPDAGDFYTDALYGAGRAAEFGY